MGFEFAHNLAGMACEQGNCPAEDDPDPNPRLIWQLSLARRTQMWQARDAFIDSESSDLGLEGGGTSQGFNAFLNLDEFTEVRTWMAA